MPRHLSVVLFVLSLPTIVYAADPKDRWLGDIDAALNAARTANKPVFLTFRCER